MIAAVAERGAACTGFVDFVAVSGDFGIEEEIIVVIRDGVWRFTVQSFGDQTKWLELSKNCEFTNPNGHLENRVVSLVTELVERVVEILDYETFSFSLPLFFVFLVTGVVVLFKGLNPSNLDYDSPGPK